MLASPFAFRAVAIATLVSLVACALPRTSSVLPNATTVTRSVETPGISGVVKTTNFIVKKGHSLDVAGTLAVFATGNIDIAGKLIVSRGASLSLIAKGALTISGSISSAPGKVEAAVMHGSAAESETNLTGSDITLGNGYTSQGDVSLATNGAGNVIFGSSVSAGSGETGVAAVPPGDPGGAQPGGSVSIGSPDAVIKIEALIGKYDAGIGVKPSAPKTIAGTRISAGTGGSGYTDVNGKAKGNEQVLTGGDGARGGDVILVADKIALKDWVSPGSGGHGGSAGYNGSEHFSAAMDPSRSLVVTLGNGGDAGSVTVRGKLEGKIKTAFGGSAGDLHFARAGNGAPGAGQSGGSTKINVGSPGKGTTRKYDGRASNVDLRGGGNGGSSNSASMAGGAGGAVSLFSSGASVVKSSGRSVVSVFSSTIDGYSSGGNGFNGCTALNGTNGGKGGQLNVPGGAFISITGSFNGGNGGDGVAPGGGGTAGTDSLGNKLGLQGNPGKSCGPFTTHALPIYIYPQKITTSTLYGETRGHVREHAGGGDLWFTAQGSSPPAGIGAISTTGAITMFTAAFTSSDHPTAIVAGPDGNLWFTNSFGSAASSIGKMTTSGTVTRFSSNLSEHPQGITAGPDGNLWFTESATYPATGKIGRITPTGTITEFSTGLTAHAMPSGITVGADHNLWFADNFNFAIGRITTDGSIVMFTGLSGNPQYIAAGPDGKLWFTESAYPYVRIGSITTGGTIKEYSNGISSGATSLDGITSGPRSSLWFLECGSLKLGQITTTGAVTEYAIPNITTNGIPLGGITQGPDGNPWFVETNNQSIVEYIPTTGAFTRLGRNTIRR